VQGLPWAAGLVGAPLVGARKSAMPTREATRGLHLRDTLLAATPPVKAPEIDGQAKAAPYTGPDDEPGGGGVCPPVRT
jgi:hypothetical protein